MANASLEDVARCPVRGIVRIVEEDEGGIGRRHRGTSMDELPDQILVEIFKTAHPDTGEGNQLLRYMGVCKHWRALVQTAVKSVTVPPWSSPQLALRQVNKLPNLRTLMLEGSRCESRELVAVFEILGRECQQLRELNLIKVVHLDQKAVDGLFWNMTMLHALVINGYHGSMKLLFLWRLASLERLHIEYCELAKTEIVSNQLTSLRMLILRNVDGIQWLYPVISFRNLEKVELQPKLSSPNALVLPSLSALANLHTFEARRLSADTMGGLHLEGLASLQTLTLHTKEDGWRCISGLKGLTNLRSLDLTSSIPEQLADITTLPFLESLKITVDGSRAPIVLSQLTTLRQLSIKPHNPHDRNELPALDKLSLLTWLDISRFSWFHNGKEQLQKLSHLPALQVCVADNVNAFSSLQLQSAAVTTLFLHFHGFMQTLFQSALSLLPNLTKLMLVGDDITPLPLLRGPYPSLEKLGLSSFRTGNVSLLESFLALTILILESLEDIEVQSLAGASNLQGLSCVDCSFPSMPPLMMLHSLRFLDLCNCSSIAEVPSLRGLGALEELKVSYCDDLLSVELLGLSSLRKVSLIRLEKLAFLSPLTELLWLQILQIQHCPRLTIVPELSSLTSLRMLEIWACPLERIPPLTGLAHLLYAKLQANGSELNMDGTHPDLTVVWLMDDE